MRYLFTSLPRRTSFCAGVLVVLMPLSGGADTYGRSAARPSANPNREARAAGFSLHPALDLSLTYDSNAFLNDEDERENDLFTDLVLGLSGRLASGRNSLTLGGWYRIRRYDKNSRLDNEDFMVTLQGVLGTGLGISDNWTLRPRASYSKTIDYSHEPEELLLQDEDSPTIRLGRPDREQQTRWSLGTDLAGPLTDKMRLDLGYGYSRIEFERDDLLDEKSQKVGGRLAFNVTDRSQVSLGGDIAELENDSFDDPARQYALRLGYRHHRTDKITFDGGLGYFWFRSDEEDVDRTGLSYVLSAHWRMTQKLRLTVTGENASELAEDDPGNARLISRVTATMRYRLTDRWWWDLGVGYRQEDYNRPSPPPETDLEVIGEQPRGDVPGGLRPFRDLEGDFIDREVEQYIARLGIRFWVNNYAHLRASGTYETTRDNVIGDYDQYRFTLALRVAL